MRRIWRLTYMITITALVVGCQVASPTANPDAGAQAAPPTLSFPTPAEVAPEKTFAEVGDVGHLSGTHGIAGKAIVAGLQTLIIQGFTYDGKAPGADLRLVMGQDYANPAAILGALEPRAYEQEFLHFTIPGTVNRENADRLVVYATETGEMLAETTFQ